MEEYIGVYVHGHTRSLNVKKRREQPTEKSDWRYEREFEEDAMDGDTTQNSEARPASDLQNTYPENAAEIADFLKKVLVRRQPIVERLSQHPELNDHGFFLLICKMYRDTFRGVGLTKTRLLNLMVTFSRHQIAHSTAEKKIKKASDVGVFDRRPDAKDARRTLYFLNKEMIAVCSEAFSGMLEDARVKPS